VSVRVEFCGVPGSGKSTLCAGAFRELRRRGRQVLDRPGMVEVQLRKRNHGVIAGTIAAVVPGWREAFLGLAHGMEDWIRFVVRHPAYAARIHGWIADTGMAETWREAVFRAVATTAFELGLAEEGSAPVLLDEGFAQRYFSLRGYGVQSQEDDAARYAETMPMPTALVWVSTPPATCLARVSVRPDLPLLMRDEPRERLPMRFEEGSKLLAGLADVLEMRGVPVLRIVGDGDVDAAAARIADFVESVG
jgi:hypothetical protein